MLRKIKMQIVFFINYNDDDNYQYDNNWQWTKSDQKNSEQLVI